MSDKPQSLGEILLEEMRARETAMYECPNCTNQFKHEIYTCVNCGHLVKSPDIDGAQMAHDAMEDLLEVDEIDKLVKHVDRTRESE